MMRHQFFFTGLLLLGWQTLAIAAAPPQTTPRPVSASPPTAPSPTAQPTPAAVQPISQPSDGIPFRELLRFSDSLIRTAEQSLIRNSQDFQTFWLRHAGKAPAPTVDFGKDFVIAVVMGEQPTAGYGACVEKLSLEKEGLQVLLKSQFPPLDSFLPMQPFSPGCLVLMPQQPIQKVDFRYLTQQQRTALPMRTLSQISNSLILTPRFVVAQDEASFRELWGEHSGQLANMPAVDFSKEMVIAAFMGEQPTGGFAVKIQDISEADGRLKVKVVKNSPSPEQMVIQMLTAPAHLVAVPRRDLPVDFE